jgi:hypothetical protein
LYQLISQEVVLKSIKELWFWFRLVICPILILHGVYVIGKLVGNLLVSQSGLPTLDSSHLIPLAGAFCALNVFFYTWKEAKVRFAVKHN